MFWTSISNLANSCTRRSVSYNERNSGMQTHTNVDISCRGSCTRCSIQEEDHVSTLYACTRCSIQEENHVSTLYACTRCSIQEENHVSTLYACTRCSIQEEDYVSTLYACIQPFKQLTGFLNSAFTCSTAGIHSATLPPTSEGSWPSNGSS